MGLYKAQLTVGPFKRGEVVDIDPTQFSRYIEKGWLKEYTEGEVVSSSVPLERPGDEGESTEDASQSVPLHEGDASPSTETEGFDADGAP